MTTYCSYSMQGKKEEFADWVSNISPEYTPFISMLSKFPVRNTMFQWQTDKLDAVNLANKHQEGSNADSVSLAPTKVNSNHCQIMRKVVMVSDTANAVSSYGREKELFYQLKKAAKELKRDHELIFLLEAQAGSAATSSAAAKTASFGHLISDTMKFGSGTGTLEQTLFQATAKSYMTGAEPNVLMYNPSVATILAQLQERNGVRQRVFENDKRFVFEVDTIVDPLGQEFKCIPNRWCPEGMLYGFRAEDVGMAVLRAPTQIQLAKQGSAEKYMIEQEVGLRLDNPEAAFMIKVNSSSADLYVKGPSDVTATASSTPKMKVESAPAGATYKWQYKGPSDAAWADVTAAQASNETTAEITIATGYCIVANSGAMFRCKVTNSSQDIYSSAAVMHVTA